MFAELNDDELIKRLRSTAFGCAHRNADAVASSERRLFVERGPAKFEEVLVHPILDILYNPNPRMDGYQFFQLSQVYLECVGKVYWRIIKNQFGLPQQLWLLQPQLVSLQLGSDGFVAAYQYSNGKQTVRLAPEEVIDIRFADLDSPYTLAYPPMQAAAELVHQNYLTREHQVNLLENKAEPSTLIAPKAGAVIGETVMERLLAIFKKKHRRNSGGVAGIPAPVDITPLSFNSKDSEFLAFYQEMKKDICYVFGVPTALMESTKSRAELEAAMVQHGRFAVNPRNKLLDAALTNRLCAAFNANLYIKSDDAAPEDTQAKATMLQGLVNAYIISADEAREKLGYEGSAPVKPAPKAPGGFNANAE